MNGVRKFAVLYSGAEYHVTKEIPFARHVVTRGEVKGVSLNSLCGAHIGLVPYAEALYANGKPTPRLYEDLPVGCVLCTRCARAMKKQKGWRRLLSHLLYRRGGFRVASR